MRRSTGLGVTLFVGLGLAVMTFLPAPVLADGDDGVVVSRPGVVFHKAGSSDIRGKGHGKSLSAALATGYSPCKVCFGRQVSVDLRGAGAAGGSATSSAMGGPALSVTGESALAVSRPFERKGQARLVGKGAAHGLNNPLATCDLTPSFHRIPVE